MLTTQADISTNADGELLGAILDGRFRIDSFMGGSNGAEVFLATDLGRNVPVIVKLLRPRFLVGEDFGARLRQEFEVMRTLEHPHIASVIGFNQLDNGSAYFVREHLSGASIANLVQKQGPMDVARVSVLLDQMAEAIDHAHSMQIIHRDICPEHFIVGKNNWGQDVCKLVNFGLAKVLGGLAESTRSDAALSGAAVVQGSPYTVSPEVAAGDEYGPAADVYSLGVTLYYMLTGKMPFESRSPHALIVAHMTKTPPSFAERVPTVWVPENVERVIMKVLSKNPKDRPQSAGELAQSFREAVGNFREGNDPTSSGLETKSQVSAKAKTVRSPSRNDVGIRIVPRAPARNNNQAGHAFSTPVYALVSLAILVVLMAYLLRT